MTESDTTCHAPGHQRDRQDVSSIDAASNEEDTRTREVILLVFSILPLQPFRVISI
jgi:hypothetical protein